MQDNYKFISSREWLEADGLGGFASGTSSGIRTRRYHALLLPAVTPPTGRMVLVNGFDAWVETPDGTFWLSSQRYAPDVITSDGAQRIEAFDWEPWPHWIFKFNGIRIEHELFVPKGEPMTCLSWRVLGPGKRDVKLFVRPFLSGRDYHSLHKGNPAFRFEADVKSDCVSWQPYPGLPGVTAGVPGVAAITNGSYRHEPHWYYNFLYTDERARGLDCDEDLAAPGVFQWNLADTKAALVLTTKEYAAANLSAGVKPLELFNERRDREQQRREQFPSRLHAAGEAYIVERHSLPPHPSLSPNGGEGDRRPGEGEASQAKSTAKTIIAGYPWFTDWGRDTFIALRGLCLATGRLADASEILLAWAKSVSQGMLPNRFPDHGEQPEYNSVDASLWFIIAVHELLQACNGDRGIVSAEDKRILQDAVEAILEGYSKGTRFGIRMDHDGLLAAGERGVQLTWMDSKVGAWVVTPRAGKPVEIQALWLNALRIASRFSPGWQKHYGRGLNAFREKFWDEERGCLFDVIDVNHRTGERDAAFRPNQIFAVGGLPFQLIEAERAERIVTVVEEKLLTPLGLRSLASGEPDYKPHYEGGVWQRDGAYHQGTVWPWLIGPFVEAWVRVRGNTPAAKQEARTRFLAPLLAHLDEAGLGHISEIADADAPHTPRGCPFQAWSVGELLRLDQRVLAEAKPERPGRKRTRDLATA